jgi:hypothetical protein
MKNKVDGFIGFVAITAIIGISSAIIGFGFVIYKIISAFF